MIEILKGTNFNFMKLKYYGLTLSAILVILGIIAAIQIARGSANLGIDFAGGTAVQIKFDHRVSLQDVRKALSNGGIKDADIQNLPTENKVMIKVKKEEETLEGLSEKIISILSESFSDNKLTIDSTTEIGPKVGKKLRVDALWAIIFAIMGILAYITFRFQFRFSLGATAATFHDVMAVLGIFFILDKEINLILISVILIIAGYSLTDTVVVFDRIRENMRSRLKESFEAVINKSINEVLSRTIITSLTTLFVALALFFLGGEVIHDFAFALILGIMIGTYSSIYVASPIVLFLGKSKLIVKKKR